jgi:ribosomal protein S18 acetylase RimI-like enzyme
MITRMGNAGDFETVAPLMMAFRKHQEQLDPALYELHPDAGRRFRQWIGHMIEDPRAIFLVAKEEGQIVGFLAASIEEDLPIFLHGEFALVRQWWVEPQHRGRGAGKALLKHAASELAATGLSHLRVRTAPDDMAIAKILSHCGLRPCACESLLEFGPNNEEHHA